jgi:hypothetical protein
MRECPLFPRITSSLPGNTDITVVETVTSCPSKRLHSPTHTLSLSQDIWLNTAFVRSGYGVGVAASYHIRISSSGDALRHTIASVESAAHERE